MDGIEIWKYFDDVIVWIKLKCKLFGTIRDIYIAVVYIVPEGSTHSRQDSFALLHDYIACIPPGSEILLCGDYNAHTNVENDYMIENLAGTNGDLDEYLCHDNTGRHELINKLSGCRTLERSSRDPMRVDTHGRCLLELCKATGLLILNGPIGHDKGIGACTRINETRATLVDYVIASPGLFPSVN